MLCPRLHRPQWYVERCCVWKETWLDPVKSRKTGWFT
jgi:hypothetical protein